MTSRPLLETRKFRVVSETVFDREGRPRERAVVRHPGAVVILPLLDDGRVLLIRNERHAVGKTLLELPAGTREPGEADEAGARRELEEETGYRASHLEPLVRFYASPGFCDELMIVFVARGLVKTEQRLEATERIEPFAVTVDELRAMIADGRIEDGKTLAGVLYWLTFGAADAPLR